MKIYMKYLRDAGLLQFSWVNYSLGKNDTISNLSNSFLENQISSKFGSTKLCYEIEFIA